MKYELELRGEDCDRETIEIEAETLEDARDQARSEAKDWIRDGDWGEDGAILEVWWTLTDEDGDDVWDDITTVAIEPDHEALIRKAGGDPKCDHDWTSEGEGGCDENPGVWSHGGTTISVSDHCRTCGLHRHQVHLGSQRNPGEHDTVEYTQPESWCPDCESESCDCEDPECDEDDD